MILIVCIFMDYLIFFLILIYKKVEGAKRTIVVR